MKQTFTSLATGFVLCLANATQAQVAGKALDRFTSAERALLACLPSEVEMPYPLQPTYRAAEAAKGRVWVEVLSTGKDKRHHLSLEVESWPSQSQAIASARKHWAMCAAPDPNVQLPISEGIGDIAWMANPKFASANAKNDPDSTKSTYITFVRGNTFVVVYYVHRGAKGEVPTGKTWMNGDPVKEIWRIARLIDSRLKALDTAPAAKRARKGKKGG